MKWSGGQNVQDPGYVVDENRRDLEGWPMAFKNINLEFSHLQREIQTYDKLQAAFGTEITIYLIYY